jgi:hypothetical protein
VLSPSPSQQWNPDATIQVLVKRSEDGGRRTPIETGIYGCPLLIGDKGFDCRLLIDETLKPGIIYELPVKFMNPAQALPHLSLGTAIVLWEGKEIATGKVIALNAQS